MTIEYGIPIVLMQDDRKRVIAEIVTYKRMNLFKIVEQFRTQEDDLENNDNWRYTRVQLVFNKFTALPFLQKLKEFSEQAENIERLLIEGPGLSEVEQKAIASEE